MKELWQAILQVAAPFKPTIAAIFMWFISNLSTVTAIVALLVLLFNLRVVYYSGKLKQIEYDKACKGE